jgi:hypothetical protein
MIETHAPLQRSGKQKPVDFLTFPVGAFTLFHRSALGLTSLADERFDFVAGEARGLTLNIGCGRKNRFIAHFLRGRGRGIDVFAYEGLTRENIIPDLSNLPFPPAIFDTVTFIANIQEGHWPQADAPLCSRGAAFAAAKSALIPFYFPCIQPLCS